MATPNPPDQNPWSNYEKKHLLAEMIKGARQVPHTALYDIIRHFDVNPELEEIPLPPGRSVSSCRTAFNEMQRSRPLQPTQPLPQPTTPSPFTQLPAAKRSFATYESPFGAPSTGRQIAPRPPSVPTSYAPAQPTDPPPKKKRGRPTRAEMQARRADAAAAAAANTISSTPNIAEAAAYAPPVPYTYPQSSASSSRPPAPMRAQSLTSVPPAPSSVEEMKAVPTTRLPVSDMLTPSAPPREPASGSPSGSSGKRRRDRSTKSEPEEVPRAYESPYARIVGDAEDTPAKTAVLRHREEAPNTSRTAPPEVPTEQSESGAASK